MTAPLQLVTDETEQALVDASRKQHDLDIQLLCSVVLDLTRDVKLLKKKVADLEGHQKF